MGRCEGTNRDGSRCKREARQDARFCYVHEPEKEEPDDRGDSVAAEDLELLDLAPILLAGILAAGLVFLLRGFGRWIPRL